MMTLTQKQIDARMTGYDEMTDHMDGTVTDDPIEQEQFDIVQKQVRAIASKWHASIMKKREAD